MPLHLSPSKTASPRVTSRTTSGVPASSADPRRGVESTPTLIRAAVTAGLRESSAGTSQSRPLSRQVRSDAPQPRLRQVGTPALEAKVRQSVAFDFEEEDLADSSFTYDPSTSSADSDNSGGLESVSVHVRLRPTKPSEESAWLPSRPGCSISLHPSIASGRTQRDAGAPHLFDGVHTGSSNGPIYTDVARPLVRAALDGYDAVVFAYGQTASGKTFTLSGDEQGLEPGIIPRAIRDVFRGIQQSESSREYLLRVSYLEIWNENIKDLLDPTNVPLIRDDRRKGSKGTVVQPLREEIVTSAAAVTELLDRGQKNRHVGATDWNERSSRSHTCFRMTIESWERDGDREGSESPSPNDSSGKKVRISELSLIDLAGSERYVSQGSDRRAEGSHINKSLLTLGKVILHLSEQSQARLTNANALPAAHIPYRDSKLTRILQNSLSGNARVAVICTLNPSPVAVEESLSTLSFAHRVKKVTTHAQRREVMEADGMLNGKLVQESQALILRYKQEAQELREKMAQMVDQEQLVELRKRFEVLSSSTVRGGHRSSDLRGDVESSEDEDGGSVSKVALGWA